MLELTMIQTMALAVCLLALGEFLRKKIRFFETFCIPGPVIGGVIFAIVALILKNGSILEFNFDTTLQGVFMTAFFTTIGFTASFKLLAKGGIKVGIFLVCAVTLVILQDAVGVGLSQMFNLNPLIGLSTGSVPMTGGHGTSAAFAPIFESKGVMGASAVAMASATFGLVIGSLIGGPIGTRLIKKHNLHQHGEKSEIHEVAHEEKKAIALLCSNTFMSASMQVIVAMGLGTILSDLLQKTGVTFPAYIGAMFAAAIMRNIADLSGAFKIKEAELDVIGSVSLGIFLSMALMSLKLWQLASLATPMIVMLAAQAVLMAAFAYFITFNVMGRDYDAAVMAAGHCGFGMGATPNAMANMGAMAQKYRYAPTAFFILPLVGSLFIDFFNAGIITFFMNLFA